MLLTNLNFLFTPLSFWNRNRYNCLSVSRSDDDKAIISNAKRYLMLRRHWSRIRERAFVVLFVVESKVVLNINRENEMKFQTSNKITSSNNERIWIGKNDVRYRRKVSLNLKVIISECTEHTGFSRVVSDLPAVRPDVQKKRYYLTDNTTQSRLATKLLSLLLSRWLTSLIG